MEQRKTSNSAERFDTTAVAEENSRLSGFIFFLLCVILIFSGVAFGAVDTWALGVLSLFSGLIVIFWIADAWRKNEFRFSSNVLQVPLLALVFTGLVQLLPLGDSVFSNDLLSLSASNSLSLAPYATRFAVIQLFVYYVFFAAALTFINNHQRVKKIVVTVVIFGSIMAFYGILQDLANFEEIYGLRVTRQATPFASFVNSHHFATFMEMTIGITLALLFGRATKKDKQLLLIIAAVIMGMAIIFTSSRGGFLSFLGVLGFIIAANLLKKQPGEEKFSDEEETRNYRQNFALLGGGFALLLILFGSVLLLGGNEPLLRGIGLQNPDDVSNGRTHFWEIALKNFLHNPILGSGLDSYGTIFSKYDTWSGMYRVEYAHNDYLQILSDAGIIGFACVAAFVFLLFKQGLKIIDKNSDVFGRNVAIGALAGCFGVLIHSFFDFPLRTPSNAFFFLALATLATTSISYPKHKRKKSKQV